jgi:carbamoyl-phosphate synthase small subunit
VLADGTVIEGYGLGATGKAPGEVCFNTAITGYQEILTDPSYAGQIITFTFPHIGNVGANDEDIETSNLASSSGVRGCVLKADITNPSNYRAAKHLDAWLKARGIIGIAGIDTRALTALIREKGMANAVIAHNPKANFNIDALKKEAAEWPGLEGMDLAKDVSATQRYDWDEKLWQWNEGYAHQSEPRFNVVAMDFGAKRNILRCLAEQGCHVTVVPATTSAEDILAMNPDGVFLSNGPGDPAATGEYAVPEIRKLVDSGKPVFGLDPERCHEKIRHRSHVRRRQCHHVSRCACLFLTARGQCKGRHHRRAKCATPYASVGPYCAGGPAAIRAAAAAYAANLHHVDFDFGEPLAARRSGGCLRSG